MEHAPAAKGLDFLWAGKALVGSKPRRRYSGVSRGKSQLTGLLQLWEDEKTPP